MIRILFDGRGVWQQLGKLENSELEDLEDLEFLELVDKDDFGPFFGPWDDYASISIYQLNDADTFFDLLEEDIDSLNLIYDGFIKKENVIYEELNETFFKDYNFDDQPYYVNIWEKYSGYLGFVDLDVDNNIFDINQLFYRSIKWEYGGIDPIIQSVEYQLENGKTVQSGELIDNIEDVESTGEENIGWIKRFYRDKKWDEINI